MVKQKNIKQSTAHKTLRPPIVAVLGHVDHGKTSLLDAIRKTSITEKEAGGITQHIGAYQIEVQSSKFKVQNQQSKITFIDTPGHEAFVKMRSRGSQVADIAILVVAATEGVKPQTVESIKHIKNAAIPMVVALNKIDLPQANPDKVIQELAKEGVLVEKFGGDVVVIPVSAKSGQGIPELLETILLIAALNELKGDINDPFEAVVIEARLDKSRGCLVTLIVKKGSLKVGQVIYTEGIEAKVRAMKDEWGKTVIQAMPSAPVEVMGWKTLPSVGVAVSAEKLVKSLSIPPKFMPKAFALPPLSETKKLKIVLKTDVAGSLEAIKESLGEEVDIVLESTGEISESDVLLAKSVGAVVIGFNIKPNKKVLLLAQAEKVRVKVYQIIYKLIEEITEVTNLLNRPEEAEQILGEAVVLAEFVINDMRVAGCKIENGVMTRGDTVRITRKDKSIGNTRIKSMRHGKQDITKADAGQECGIIFDKKLDFVIGDRIIAYKQKELLS